MHQWIEPFFALHLGRNEREGQSMGSLRYDIHLD